MQLLDFSTVFFLTLKMHKKYFDVVVNRLIGSHILSSFYLKVAHEKGGVQ